jgi:hypothetical protein
MEAFTMVAINQHNHGDDGVCRGCLFRQRLAEHIEWTAGQPERLWFDLLGEVSESMALATAALIQLRCQRLDADRDDDGEHAVVAADAISQLAVAIDGLWHTLMDEDQGDDPGVGL